MNVPPNRIQVRECSKASLILFDLRKTILGASEFLEFSHSLDPKDTLSAVPNLITSARGWRCIGGCESRASARSRAEAQNLHLLFAQGYGLRGPARRGAQGARLRATD